VLIGHDAEWEGLHSIDIDNTTGGYKAGAHLCELGHEDIGVILGNPQLRETADRREGLRAALEEAGRTVPDERVAIGDYSQESGYEIVQRWIANESVPSGLFCASDTMAMGALLALHEGGYDVPGDVAVVGFDGLPSSKYTIPPLTTVRQPVYEKGKKAANVLIDKIEGAGSSPAHTALEPELVVRKSCGS
jgi:LacI family transcriptional regulator